ncbi:TPA: mRNA surveillance protein pelota [Candidatus Woesearchaeota archaeon]|nr:mRNA surveillance protein pelota [Candidatus Woesearchaeota archaeon]
MKLIRKDLKNGRVVVQPQGLDDLWLLSRMITKGDAVTGRTTRKVRLGSSEEAVKKTYILSILVEEAEFKDQALRVSGTTTEPKDDVPKGAHHAIAAEPGDVLTIVKEKWQKYQINRLESATETQLNALIIVFDRETALFASLKREGYELIAELKGKVRKKDYDTAVTGNFYKEIIVAAREYDERRHPDRIIAASPAFWKDELMHELANDAKAKALREKIVLATCSSVSQNAIDEVLKRPEMETVLATANAARELKLVDELMIEISREGKAAYGKKEVENAVEAAAAEKLLITDAMVYNNKSSEALLKKAEEKGAKVVVINSENTAGQKLDALGGIGAMLRYRIS